MTRVEDNDYDAPDPCTPNKQGGAEHGISHRPEPRYFATPFFSERGPAEVEVVDKTWSRPISAILHVPGCDTTKRG